MVRMVTICQCQTYETNQVQAAVDRSIRLLGGLDSYVSKGQTILLKVNLISPKDPDQAATTSPVLVECLARRLVEFGCRVIIGDSPGGLFNTAYLKRVYSVCGMDKAAKASGAQLSLDTGETVLSYPQGQILKSMTVTSMSRSCDRIISVGKLKTHSMMTYTGAVKNLFGTIPGAAKAEYHLRMPKSEDFAQALLDIYQAQAPVLNFLDAVDGMEGNGPTNGRPRHIGCLLASDSGHQLDKAAASLIGLGVENVPTLKAARGRGYLAEPIELTGDDPSAFVVKDFKMPDSVHMDLTKGGWAPSFLMKHLRPRVRFDPERCVRCGSCVSHCPAKALKLAEGRKVPVCDYSSCIRCYCCQELCPKGAVSIHEPGIVGLVKKL